MKAEIKAGQVWIFPEGMITIRSVDDKYVMLDEIYMGRHFEGLRIVRSLIHRLINDEDWALSPNPNKIWRDLCSS